MTKEEMIKLARARIERKSQERHFSDESVLNMKRAYKMKNCFNCAKGDWDNRVKCIESGCVNKDKWELKE